MLVFVGQRGSHRKLATAARVRSFASGRFGGRFDAALLRRLFLFLIDRAAATQARRRCCRRYRLFLFLKAPAGFLFRVTAGHFVGGLARLFFRLALLGGCPLLCEATLFNSAMLGILFGALAGLFLVN